MNYLQKAQKILEENGINLESSDRACLYLRYSSENQRDGYSIEAQFSACLEYCLKKNYYITKIYIDEATSASKNIEKRDEFLNMIDTLKEHLFNICVVHKIDRFSRGTTFETALFKNEFKKYGVKRESVLETAIDESPEGEMFESFIEAIARFTSRNIGREAMKGLKEKAKLSLHVGGLPPLGYKVNEKKEYEIESSEAEIVKQIFTMYSEGKGYAEIIDNLKCFRTKRGNAISKGSIHDILKNEKYIGNYFFNKRSAIGLNGKRSSRKFKPECEIIRKENAIPSIIKKELWDMVQEKMEKNKKTAASFKKNSHIYICSNVLICGLCKKPMHGASTKNRNSERMFYYECSRAKRFRDCKMHKIKASFVEKVVIEYLKEIFCDKNIVELKQWILSNKDSFAITNKEKINRLRFEITGLKIEANKIVDELLASPSQILRDRLMSLEAQIEIKEKELKKCTNNIKGATNLQYLDEYLKAIKFFFDKPTKEQKLIVESFIEYIEVIPQDEKKTKFIIKTKLDRVLSSLQMVLPKHTPSIVKMFYCEIIIIKNK